MDAEIIELSRDRLPEMVELCREALDLPEDAPRRPPWWSLWRSAPRPAGSCCDSARYATARWSACWSVRCRPPSRGTGTWTWSRWPRGAPPGRRPGAAGRAEQRLAALGAARGAARRQPAVLRLAGHRRALHPGGLRRAGARLPAGPDRLEHDRRPVYDGSPALRPTEAAEQRLAGRGVTVRRAEPEDLPALTAFARSTFGGAWDGEAGRFGRAAGRRRAPRRTGR